MRYINYLEKICSPIKYQETVVSRRKLSEFEIKFYTFENSAKFFVNALNFVRYASSMWILNKDEERLLVFQKQVLRKILEPINPITNEESGAM